MRTTRRISGFTLVELLVVIGIIAALIGILLPVLSRVQSRGRDVKCQSNIRQCLALFMTYAAENKGSLPWGDVYVRANNFPGSPMNWDDAAGDGRLITCWSIISRLSSKAYSGDDVFIGTGQTSNPDAARNSTALPAMPRSDDCLRRQPVHVCRELHGILLALG